MLNDDLDIVNGYLDETNYNTTNQEKTEGGKKIVIPDLTNRKSAHLEMPT